MGTKNNPGKFDCYANAEPDEPMFVLLGRDPTAGFAVLFWIVLRKELEADTPEKIEEARKCASDLAIWTITHGKKERFLKLLELLRESDFIDGATLLVMNDLIREVSP